MMIRQSYETLFATIKSMCNSGLRRWVITGAWFYAWVGLACTHPWNAAKHMGHHVEQATHDT